MRVPPAATSSRRRDVGGPWKTVVYHRFPKLGVVCDVETHFILAAREDRGPKPDVADFRPLARRSAGARADRPHRGRRRLRLGGQPRLRARANAASARSSPPSTAGPPQSRPAATIGG